MAMTTKKILLTGFHPFAHYESNPTELLARKLNGKVFGNYTIKGVVLPVSYQKAPETLRFHLESFNPDIVVTTGLAGDRDKISLELIAINFLNAKTADNDGVVKSFEKIEQEADAYFSSLPLKKILSELEKEKIPAHLSTTAGTFICNQVFFHLMKWQKNFPDKKCGFIHYPNNLSTEMLLKATEKILFTLTQSSN